MRFRDGWALTLASLLAFAGVAHFIAADTFNAIVPHLLPGPDRAWTIASGTVEICLAIGLFWRVTRRVAATLSAIFFVLVFPANIQMAIDWASRPASEFLIALLRLPLQIPLIWWALHVRHRAASAHPFRPRAEHRTV